MSKKPIFVFIGQYDDPVLAKADLDIVHELHHTGVIGTYDAAVVTKEADGKVKIHKHEKPTQHGAWTGAVVGAVVGIIFPPSIIGTAAVGAVAGGLIGHFWRGMSRKDIHEMGELLDTGEALLIVAGRDKLSAALDKAGLKAAKRIEKEIDVEADDVEAALVDAEQQLG